MTSIKGFLSSEHLLQYFDVENDTTLTVDSSQSVLGDLILQGDHPVAYGSGAFTETEQTWSQIEKEFSHCLWYLKIP